MNKWAYVFFGMALQAFMVALLQASDLLTVTPAQQTVSGILFFMIFVVTATVAKNK